MLRGLGSPAAQAVVTVVALAVAALCISPPVGATTTPLSITTSALDPGEVGAPYSFHLLASGGTAPYGWSTTTPLPPGLTLSSSGLLSGTPELPTDEQLTVSVADGAQGVASASLALDVLAGPSITTSTVADPVLGVPYTTSVTAIGGTPPYMWSVTSGPLPLGLVLNSVGVLSGLPAATGTTTTTITVADAAGSRTSEQLPVTVDASAAPQQSYLVTSTTGAVSAFASPGVAVPQTIDDGPDAVVAIAIDATANRFWLATANGQVEPGPGAPSFGSLGPHQLVGHIVGLAAAPDGTGYWLASSTGRVYGFGSAPSFGSLGPHQLVGHIVGLAATPDGTGYWLCSSTGRVYGFGSARALRRHGRVRLNPSVVGITADPNSDGYWLVTRAGRVYAYGRAELIGSLPASKHLRSVVGIAAAPGGDGFWLVNANGMVDAFGAATLLAGVEVAPPSGSVVAIASAS